MFKERNYLWNVIKRFRETEMIVALNDSRVHKMIARRIFLAFVLLYLGEHSRTHGSYK